MAMAKGGGGTSGGPSASNEVTVKASAKAGAKPFVGTPGREEARAVQWDLSVSREAWLMAQQDGATVHPGPGPVQAQGPARVTSTDWVEHDRQMRLAQAAARSVSGQLMPAPGGMVTLAGPTQSEAQAMEAMRARMAKVWGVPGEATCAAGVETRAGEMQAWTAELPAKAKGRAEEREP